jgi:hypothetical protein
VYNYPPLAPYCLAAIVALFGDNLWVFQGVGIALGIACAAGVYALTLFVADVAASFFATLLFLVFGLFAYSTWGSNFVLPYSYAATVSITCAIWSVFFLLHHLRKGPKWSFTLSVGLMFAACFSKLEVGTAVGGVHLLAWWAYRIPKRRILGTIATGFLLCVVFVGVFHARTEEEHHLFSENLSKFSGSSDAAAFFKSLAGFDDPARSLMNILKNTCYAALLVGLGYGLSLLSGKMEGNRWLMALSGIAVLVAFVWLAAKWADYTLLLAVLPLAIVSLLYLWLRNRSNPLLLLAAFVVLSAPRMLLSYYPHWYGFYLFAPAYPFLAGLLGRRLTVPGRSLVFKGCMAGLLLLVLFRFVTKMENIYALKTSPIITPKGVMYDLGVGRAEIINTFLAYTKEHFDPDTTMVVFPEGISLNYFTGTRNPIAYDNFIPPEITSLATERRMVAELEKTPPEYVLLLQRNLEAFGKEQFGKDYAVLLWNWVTQNYTVEREFRNPEGSVWWMILYRKRDLHAP